MPPQTADASFLCRQIWCFLSGWNIEHNSPNWSPILNSSPWSVSWSVPLEVVLVALLDLSYYCPESRSEMMHILIKICSPVDRFDALRPGLDVETGCIPPGSNSRHNLSVTQRWGCGLYGQVNRLNIASSKLHQPDTSSMLGWGHHLFSYKASVKSLDVKQLKCIEAVSARKMHSISEER